jgi:uncharacterized protein involved in exopolysaccharide biosynthesis
MGDSENTTQGTELLTRVGDLDSAGNEETDETLILKITRFIRLCWSRRKVVYIVLAIGILISLLVALVKPNQYTAVTTLLPANSSSSPSKLMSLLESSSAASAFGGDALGIGTSADIYVDILESRNVLDSMITRFNLLHYYKARQMEDARKALVAVTKVEQDRKSGLFTIRVTFRDPVLASRIANQYVAELNRVLTDNSTSSARRERIFLEGRLKDVKRELDESAESLSQFSTKTKMSPN